MSGHRLPADLNLAPFEVADPGDGEALNVDRWNMHVPLTIAASTAETNTLADPTQAGQRVHIIAVAVGAGGSRTITASSALNASAETYMLFDAVDERCVIESVPVGSGDFEWRVTDSENVTVS